MEIEFAANHQLPWSNLNVGRSLLFSYFWNGLQHFLVGLVFVAAYFGLRQRPIPRNLSFWIGILLTSSAIFFLPTHFPFLGRSLDYLYQFLHYPFSDWDLLISSGSWHRSFITHSFLITLPLLTAGKSSPRLFSAILGFNLGLASHLIWDGVSGSMLTRVIFIPGWLSVTGVTAKAWLIGNGVAVLANAWRQDPRKG